MLIHEPLRASRGPLMDQYKETMPWKCAFGAGIVA